MPRTLWRYIFLESFRLVLIAACVLVTVIAFAVTVKPLGDGKLNAAQAVSFMLYAIPPMLAYALPFAAGFGTTLAYHRLADDNEITAAKAGGLSYRNILAPALAIGVVLAVTVGLLNDQVIPRFLTRMEHLITQDLTQVMVNQLDQGQSATFGDFNNTEIHADRVINYPLAPDSPYERQVRLDGLVVIETGPAGGVTLEATSSTAWLLIFRGAALPEASRGGFSPDDLIAKIAFDNGQAYKDGRFVGDLTNFETEAYALPSAFDDDPKYLTGAELRGLHDHPEAMSYVDSRRLDLARAIATAQTIRTLERKAATAGQLVFNAPSQRTVFVSTGGFTWYAQGYWQIDPARGQAAVEIEEQGSDGTVTRSQAKAARLVPQTAAPASDGLFAPGVADHAVSLRFSLELEDVTVGTSTGDARLDTVTQVAQDQIPNLTTEDDPMPALAALSCNELLAQAVPYRGQEKIDASAANLTRLIADLAREVLSKQQERYAMAASCLVMVLTGAVMALKLKDKPPLIIYLWSFFPALTTLIMIASGQSTIHKDGVIGVPLLWSGVVAMGLFALLTLRSLARR